MPKRLVYGIIYDPTNKFGMVKYVTDDIIEYLRKQLTEYLEQHELKQKIMDPKNLETAGGWPRNAASCKQCSIC
jgi:lipid II:glycine glycyltransferase (peptidoglycan interpeptide bridge formation enzyme)